MSRPEQKPLRLDRRRPVAPQVFDELRGRIVTLQLAPGTPLSRSTLAESFGVSQTPIRDALLRLEAEGLVIVYPQASTLVSPINLDRARETHFLRTALECEVARTIARDPGAHHLGPAERVLDEMEAVWDRHHDHGAFRPKDQAFHLALFEATGRERLWALIVQRSGDIDRLRNLHLPLPGKAPQILADHRTILRALKAGDAEGAQAAVRRHLSGTLASLDEITHAYPEFFR